MNTFPNDYGIGLTHFKTETTVFCPIGKDYYKADIEVWVTGQKRIVDFLDINDFCVKELNGKVLSHEELTAVVFQEMEREFQPEHLKVSVVTEAALKWCDTVIEK